MFNCTTFPSHTLSVYLSGSVWSHWTVMWSDCVVFNTTCIACNVEVLSMVCSDNDHSAALRLGRLQPVSVRLLSWWRHRGRRTRLRWMPAERRYPSRILRRNRVRMLSGWSDCCTWTVSPRLSERSLLRTYSSFWATSRVSRILEACFTVTYPWNVAVRGFRASDVWRSQCAGRGHGTEVTDDSLLFSLRLVNSLWTLL